MRAGMAVLTIALALSAGAANAQTIDPGMSRDEVVAKLGQPASERARGQFTYLFYVNGCERRCGMSDVVTLENGAVIDAIFRKAGRGYSGASTSPAGVSPAPTRGGGGGGGEMGAPSADDAAGGARGGGLIISKPATPAASPAPASAPAPASVGGVTIQPATGPSVFRAPPVNPDTRPSQPNDTTIRDTGTLRQGGPANPKPGDVLSPADSAQLRRLRTQQQADTVRPAPTSPPEE